MRVFQILAALRRMLAARPLNSMGAVVHDAIQTDFIPRLHAMLEKAKDDAERAKIQEMIALFEKYSDPRHPESKIYNDSAANIVSKMVSSYGLGADAEDEVAQHIATRFYDGKWMNALHKFKVEELQGPLQLNKLWTTIIYGGAREILRNLHRQEPGFFKTERETDEGTAIDPLAQLPAKPEDQRKIEELLYEMKDYVEPRLHSAEAKSVFDLWWNLMVKRGDVNIDREIVPVAVDKFGISRSQVFNLWKDIQMQIAQFYTRELGVRLTPHVKKKLHLSSVDVLTYEFFRRRIAAWVLGLVP